VLGRWAFLGVVLAAGSALSSQASAGECVPARLSDDTVALPAPWRHALEALVAATAREGQPWSCPNARVTLVPRGHDGEDLRPLGAAGLDDGSLPLLQVEDASGVRRRPVASPAEVLPLGEAMLARTYPPEPAVLPAQPSPDGENPAPMAIVEGADRGAPHPYPRFPEWAPPPFDDMPHHRRPLPPSQGSDLQVDLLVGARYTGPTPAVLVGPELRASLGFGRWFGALVARYDSAVAVFQPVPPQFSLASMTIGLAGGYRLLTAPIELTLAVEPTLGVVLMGAQSRDMSEPDLDSRVDLRLGARLGAAIPVSERLRVACAVGSEGVPAALFTDRHSRRHDLPSIPGYLVGISLGMEVLAIR
jgi:hypothetical protein